MRVVRLGVGWVWVGCGLGVGRVWVGCGSDVGRVCVGVCGCGWVGYQVREKILQAA